MIGIFKERLWFFSDGSLKIGVFIFARNEKCLSISCQLDSQAEHKTLILRSRLEASVRSHCGCSSLASKTKSDIIS